MYIKQKKTEPGEAAAQVVTGIRVRALGAHEHNAVRYARGEAFTMSPETAELAARRGDIDIVQFIEEVSP